MPISSTVRAQMKPVGRDKKPHILHLLAVAWRRVAEPLFLHPTMPICIASQATLPRRQVGKKGKIDAGTHHRLAPALAEKN
jgi:hypothetical protein